MCSSDLPHGATRTADGVVPPPDWSAEEFALAREQFLTEGRLLARFTQPGIAQVHFVFEERGTAYLALEYVRGETLAERLRRDGPLAPEEARRIGLAVLDTLEAVHAAGIVHGDLKPENLLLACDGRVVLVDFGAARVAGAGSRTAIWVSPAYAPLEQYARTAPVGPYTDLYALAATLYHAITGTPPPAATDRARGVRLRSPSELRAGVPSALAAAIVAGLAMEVRHRPASAAEFRQAIAGDCPEEAPPAPSDSLARPATSYPGARRRPSGVQLLATIALLAFFVPLAHSVLFSCATDPLPATLDRRSRSRSPLAFPGWLEAGPETTIAWNPYQPIVVRWTVHTRGSWQFSSRANGSSLRLRGEWFLADGTAIAPPTTRSDAPEGAGWPLGDDETGEGVRIVEDRFHVPAWALAAALRPGQTREAGRRPASGPQLLASPRPAWALEYRAAIEADLSHPAEVTLSSPTVGLTVTLPPVQLLARHVRACRQCDGASEKSCPSTGECRGAGWLLRCFVCHGTGAIPTEAAANARCGLCGGDGWVDDATLVRWERRGDVARATARF